MDYNPFSPEVQENPYPYYAYLRAHAQVYQIPGVGWWAVSRYDDVLSAFKDPQTFSSTIYVDALVGQFRPYFPAAPFVIGSDPPVHTRLRKLVSHAFTPRQMSSIETDIEEVARRLLDRVDGAGSFDLVHDLAEPLPVTIIAELMGVEPDRRQDFRLWSDEFIAATKGEAVTVDERERIAGNLTAFVAYFRAKIEALRQKPSDTLLGALVRAEEENQHLSTEEIINLAVNLLVGGNETTTNLIGNAMLALLADPEQLAQVQAQPQLIPNVVEETLRYDAPVQVSFRQTMQETQIAGTTIPAGAMVLLLIGAANRDESKFPDPDRFDITRNADGHLAFVYGIHHCIGAPLARLEAKVALQAVCRRFPRLSRTDQEVPRIASVIVRGPKTLPLKSC